MTCDFLRLESHHLFGKIFLHLNIFDRLDISHNLILIMWSRNPDALAPLGKYINVGHQTRENTQSNNILWHYVSWIESQISSWHTGISYRDGLLWFLPPHHVTCYEYMFTFNLYIFGVLKCKTINPLCGSVSTNATGPTCVSVLYIVLCMCFMTIWLASLILTRLYHWNINLVMDYDHS